MFCGMPRPSRLSPPPSLPRPLLQLDRLPLLAEAGELLPLQLLPLEKLPPPPLRSRRSSDACAAAGWSASLALPADQSARQMRYLIRTTQHAPEVFRVGHVPRTPSPHFLQWSRPAAAPRRCSTVSVVGAHVTPAPLLEGKRRAEIQDW